MIRNSGNLFRDIKIVEDEDGNWLFYEDNKGKEEGMLK